MILNTHEIIKELEAAGFKQNQAEAILSAGLKTNAGLEYRMDKLEEKIKELGGWVKIGGAALTFSMTAGFSVISIILTVKL